MNETVRIGIRIAVKPSYVVCPMHGVGNALALCLCQWLRRELGEPEAGASIVIFTLMLTILMGMAGLAIDGSNSYLQNQRMQIAADAAALGGARVLALGGTTSAARTEAQALGIANGSDAIPNADITFYASDTEVQVVATRTFPTFFAVFLGYDSTTVSATARASFMKVIRLSADYLLPLTIPCSNVATYTIGSVYTLKDSPTGPGNFSWVTWNGSTSATTMAANLTTPGLSGVKSIGDWIQGSTGQMNSSAVRAALDALIANQTVVTVPLYDATRAQGANFDYRVCGFAEFVLTGYHQQNKTISGKFLRTLERSETPAGTSPSYGAYDVRITQ